MVLAAARPQEEIAEASPVIIEEVVDANSDIIRMESVQNEDGSFSYGFETTDPIVQDVSGQIQQIGDNPGVVMTGTYSFVAKDEDGNDVPVTINWTAGPGGFQATGDAIPQAPEDPNAEAQAQAYAAAGGVPQLAEPEQVVV
ncbi:larval cuticle protein 16/17-like [Pollicipes pollicipes]|uniref:larval cuticle protein 16/17-like n=1 Tax=Pollicipes pollicipes TaxID=41117 RepID=UPI001884BC65|nr:larval cuticle protein 16/17-like [Pollicipes pollicipes]